MVIVILKFTVALLGLTLPGYLLARLLRLECRWSAAFPFSALLLCQAVVLLAILGGPISFTVVSTLLAVFTAVCGLLVLRRKESSDVTFRFDGTRLPGAPLPVKASVFFALVLVSAVAFRTTLYPLGGFDTFTRWDALAREMLRYGSLSFYPPVTPADYAIYFNPDGFPPLVASVYWWIYASLGAPYPALTSVSVVLQLAAVLGLTFKTVEDAFGARAAAVSLMALIASPLFVWSFEIGQETGFLAISVAGQFWCALAARRRPGMSTVMAAALFASLGALAREYGPALALPGFLVLLGAPGTRRLAFRYAVLVAALSSPWYLRNWVVAGNPFYSHALPGGFRVNEVFVALARYYEGLFAPHGFTMQQWGDVLYEILAGISIPFVVGMPYLIRNGRTLFPFLISAALVTILWVWSIADTCGGVGYSMRVLTPAIVVLAIATGAAYAHYDARMRHRWQHTAVSAVLLILAGWGTISALAYPLPPEKIFSSITSTGSGAPEFCSAHADLAGKMKGLRLPPTGVLTDSAYLAVMLQRETKFRPILTWNPEVSFIFDPQASGEEIRRKLVDLNIRLVAVSKSSLDNEFLSRSAFYKNDYKHWSMVLVAEDDFALFELPASAGR